MRDVRHVDNDVGKAESIKNKEAKAKEQAKEGLSKKAESKEKREKRKIADSPWRKKEVTRINE